MKPFSWKSYLKRKIWQDKHNLYWNCKHMNLFLINTMQTHTSSTRGMGHRDRLSKYWMKKYLRWDEGSVSAKGNFTIESQVVSWVGEEDFSHHVLTFTQYFKAQTLRKTVKKKACTIHSITLQYWRLMLLISSDQILQDK